MAEITRQNQQNKKSYSCLSEQLTQKFEKGTRLSVSVESRALEPIHHLKTDTTGATKKNGVRNDVRYGTVHRNKAQKQ